MRSCRIAVCSGVKFGGMLVGMLDMPKWDGFPCGVGVGVDVSCGEGPGGG
jgi:hypothetical protein